MDLLETVLGLLVIAVVCYFIARRTRGGGCCGRSHHKSGDKG